jgi:hypothetical protein
MVFSLFSSGIQNKNGQMLRRKVMWQGYFTINGFSWLLWLISDKQAENLSVGKAKSYQTINISQFPFFGHWSDQQKQAVSVFA